ncbi:MAG: 3-hydroxybutyryl-CoA dehydrogenase [Desulfitibacter sp. BRH_c19]|nr:MAG: 3-hydroxybutyryl-CoA dehydrogenase [Desulfitibacter sp. BRH_c19]
MNVQSINTIGIAGAGTMGATIAQIFAQFQYEVIVYDYAEEGLVRGKEIVKNNQNNLINQSLLSEDKAQQAINRIVFTTDINSLSSVDLLVECISENLNLKQDFFEEISNVVREEAILTTNTSGLSINKIAMKTKNKIRFAGMHWWNPPHLIPLVEIIKGDYTSIDIVNILIDITKQLKKMPVIVKKDIPGFIGNRLQYALLREALHIIQEEAASPEDVDNTMKYGLGYRYAGLGPIETCDLGGIDVFNNVGSYLFKDLNKDIEIPKKLQDLYLQNHLGIKTGRGFYEYSGDKDKEALRRRDTHFVKMLKYIYSDLLV